MNIRNERNAGAKDSVADPEQNASAPESESKSGEASAVAREFGGPKGLEPTRYGDWEQQGRCSDF